MASILRLCHHLLNLQEQIPQHDAPNLQLLCVNLERRWEAIVMQSTQWQRRFQRELGEEQVSLEIKSDYADFTVLFMARHIENYLIHLTYFESRASFRLEQAIHRSAAANRV